MPELYQLGLLAQVDIVDLRSELVEDDDLAGRARFGEGSDLLEGHIRDGMIVENEIDIEILIVFQLVVNEGKIARKVVSSQRNEGELP